MDTSIAHSERVVPAVDRSANDGECHAFERANEAMDYLPAVHTEIAR